jgi:CheY-like chemotaxis protein
MLMSALGAEQDRISGFTRGADDYLPKPFSLAELDARVDALLRRVAFDRGTALRADVGEVMLDHDRQDVIHNGNAAGLTASEFRLLVTPGAPRRSLEQTLPVPDRAARAYTRLDRGLDVHVCNLRRKLADISAQHLQIQAVRGQGVHPGRHGTALMRRHPLLWKLAVLQVSFCLLLTWLIWTWGLSVERSTYFLSQADQDYLARYAQQAEQAWNQGGAEGAEAWRRQLEQAEDTWWR